MPWIAQEAGLFQKYSLDFQLVFIASSGLATAAILGRDVEVSLTGGVGIVRAFVQGNTDLVFIGGVKNVLTVSIVAGGEIKRPEDLKGRKIGVSRIGGNSHYFTIQALRRHGMEPGRDFTFIQCGGEPELLAALAGGGRRCCYDRAADGCSGSRAWVSLCRLWARSPDSLRSSEFCHPSFSDSKAASGHRAIYAGYGGGWKDFAYRQGIHL